MPPLVLRFEEQKLYICLKEIMGQIQEEMEKNSPNDQDEEILITQAAEVAVKLHGLLEQRGIRVQRGNFRFRANFDFYKNKSNLHALHIFLIMDVERLNDLSATFEQMRQMNTIYKEEFSVGTIVRVVSETQLRDFKKNWKLHNPLTEEQIKFAGREGKVKSVDFHNEVDEIYEIEGIEGVWHQVCLESI